MKLVLPSWLAVRVTEGTTGDCNAPEWNDAVCTRAQGRVLRPCLAHEELITVNPSV